MTARAPIAQPLTRERIACLRVAKPLCTFNEAELAAFAAGLAWREVEAQQELVSHLSSGDGVFFVVEGAFKVTMTTAYGREVALRRLGAGHYFGQIAALTGAPRSVRVAAEKASLVGECSGALFRDTMQQHAGFASAIAADLARMTVALTDRLFELAALEARFRLYAELLRLARAGARTSEGVCIYDAPTHEELAAAIGAKRETVTREMRYLASEAVLSQQKRELLIKDEDRLRRMLRGRAGDTVSQLMDWPV